MIFFTCGSVVHSRHQPLMSKVGRYHFLVYYVYSYKWKSHLFTLNNTYVNHLPIMVQLIITQTRKNQNLMHWIFQNYALCLIRQTIFVVTFHWSQEFIRRNVDFLQNISRKVFPCWDNIILSQDVFWWSQVYCLVQCARIINRLHCICCNIVFITKYNFTVHIFVIIT